MGNLISGSSVNATSENNVAPENNNLVSQPVKDYCQISKSDTALDALGLSPKSIHRSHSEEYESILSALQEHEKNKNSISSTEGEGVKLGEISNEEKEVLVNKMLDKIDLDYLKGLKTYLPYERMHPMIRKGLINAKNEIEKNIKNIISIKKDPSYSALSQKTQARVEDLANKFPGFSNSVQDCTLQIGTK